MSAHELAMWQAMDSIHPIGDIRADMRNGILADVVRAAHGAKPIGINKYIIKPKSDADDDEDREIQDIDNEGLAALLGMTVEGE